MSLRPVDLARLCLGLVAIARPGSLLPTGTDSGGRARALTRILGARYLAQSASGFAFRGQLVPQVDAAIDLTHAASMLALAAADRPHRRVALLSATLSTGFAAADLRASHRKRA